MGVKFLLSVSLSSKETRETPWPGNFAILICTITQETELRFFRVSKLSAAELGAQPWLEQGITIFQTPVPWQGDWMVWLSCSFEAVIAGKISRVPIHGFLTLWPWSVLPGTHLDFFQPYQRLTESSHRVLYWWLFKINVQRISIFQSLFYSEFPVQGLSGFTTSSAMDLQRQKIDNLCIIVGSCL